METTDEKFANEIADKMTDTYRLTFGKSEITNAALAMATYKDEQPINDLGGWHSNEPTSNIQALVKLKYPVMLYHYQTYYTVAEWDVETNRFYGYVDGNEGYPIAEIEYWDEWKVIESAPRHISISYKDKHFSCDYIEEVVRFLTELFNREVIVSDILEQLTSNECDFIVFGKKIHYKLNK